MPKFYPVMSLSDFITQLCGFLSNIRNSGPPRVFWDSGRRAIYFQGFGEKSHSFSGIWGESITFWGFREQRAEEKDFRELGRKLIFLSGSREQTLPWGGGSFMMIPSALWLSSLYLSDCIHRY